MRRVLLGLLNWIFCNNVLKIKQKLQINLIGTPNVGKTSLFNYLTGENNLIGNWDGVTTDITSATFHYLENLIHINDLPGCYSLVASSQMSLDEKLVCKYLHKNNTNEQIFINVISLENLARDLYLTLQLLERNCKIIILLNIYNYSEINNLSLEHKKLIIHLQNTLNCKVIPCNVVTGYMLQEFKESILLKFNFNIKENNLNNLLYTYIPENIIQNLEYLLKQYNFKNLEELIIYLEGDVLIKEVYKDLNFSTTKSWDVLFASSRHDFIDNCLLVNFKQFYKGKTHEFTERMDTVFLHQYYGLPIFVSIIYMMFLCVNKFGNLLQQYFNQTFVEIFINPIVQLLNFICCPNFLLKIFNDGIAIGLETLWNFIPILFLMNMCLLFLENCGYMVRVVFLLDKLMGFLGLSGRSIIPMIIGFGCNVPAINGAKIISQKRDKIITILMTPFMSCNARLVTYSIFATAFFGDHQINIIFYLYLIGIIFGIFTGFLLNKILDGSRDNLLMELPKYKMPSIKFIIKTSCYKVKSFISNAGFMIILICSVIAAIKLLDFDFHNLLNNKLFKFIILIFKPIGIDVDNWPAVASLFTGLIAKEAIVGSLYSFYYTNDQEIFKVLCTRFGDYKSAFAYLLFILLSFPCVSVVTSIAKELGKYWAVFTVIWTTWLAYFVSICYYQLATFKQHPIYSAGLLLSMFSIFVILLCGIKFRVVSLNLQERQKKTTLIPLIIDHYNL